MFVLHSTHMHECHTCESFWEEFDDAENSLASLGALLFFSDVTQDLWICMVQSVLDKRD